MGDTEKVVARFNNGKVLKGYIEDFRIDSNDLVLAEAQTRKEHIIPVDELKAIFFVKTFKGYKEYREKKAFGIRDHKGKKVFVKFHDRESMIGFIDGELPWDRGFSLAKLGRNAKGFFMIPVDGDSNNNKIFVIGSSIKHITIMVGK